MEPEIKSLLDGIAFVVEATSYEQLSLWQQWSTEAQKGDLAWTPPKRLRTNFVAWEGDRAGWMVEVGKVNGAPVCISMMGATLDGVRVLFYEATSRVVDWGMIEAWFKENCWPRWDSGTRRAHCDAMNFHHCLDAIRERNAASPAPARG